MADDNEMIKKLFIDESEEQLQYMQDDILALEDQYDPEIMGRVFRAFHTMKGSANLLGFDNLATFTHRVEDLLSDLRNLETVFSKNVVDALLASLDAVNNILDDVRNDGDDSHDLSTAMDKVIAARAAFSSTDSPPTPPAAEEETVAIQPASPMETKNADRASKKGQPIKILVVEDDFTSRNILQIFFSKQFGSCHIAKDGLEGIQAFTHAYELDPPEPYDLICMDIKMPQMDGLTATKTIREIERGKGVEGTPQESVIIITSAMDESEDIVMKSYRNGANHYFTKPLDLSLVKEQMKNCNLI